MRLRIEQRKAVMTAANGTAMVCMAAGPVNRDEMRSGEEGHFVRGRGAHKLDAPAECVGLEGLVLRGILGKERIIAGGRDIRGTNGEASGAIDWLPSLGSDGALKLWHRSEGRLSDT